MWGITDITGMAASNPKIVADFARKNTLLSKEHIIEECVFTNRSIQKLMVKIYNGATKSNTPVFNSKEESMEWILERQRKGLSL